jgi:hypothetical protein
LKNFFVKIFYLTVVLCMAGFTGCRGPLEPLREAPVSQEKGRVVISIGGGTDGAGARTVAPGTGVFTKYTLAFTGPAAHDPVDITGGYSAAVELSPGSWTIGAVGYTGTAGNYVAAAEGSAQVTVVEEVSPPPVIIVLGPKTGGVQGTFSYSIAVPVGVTGSLFITTAGGGAVSGGSIAVTAGTTNTGTRALDPGQYLARLRLEKNGSYAGVTEALHIYSGLTSALPPRTYTEADFSQTPVPDRIVDQVMVPLTGVWYSYYAGIGRLDGYRIGRWRDFDALMGTDKLSLFPNLERSTYTSQTGGNIPGADDFFVFYDDTVYGEQEDGSGGGLEITMRYIGIVRAVNVFDGNPDRGVIIVEYLKGCAPQWDDDIKDGQLPFFGIYYKKVDADTVQMANAVDLTALYDGDKYYTETATLREAIDKNTAENESAFIDWNAGIPQDRES